MMRTSVAENVFKHKFQSQILEYKYLLLHIKAMQLWMGYLPLLCLKFLIYNMEIILHYVCVIACKLLRIMHNTKKMLDKLSC